MLERQIQIFAHIAVLTYSVKHIIRELCGICVVQPQPLYSVNLGQAVHQRCYLRLAVEVSSIVCQILCQNLKLFNTNGNQIFNLCLNILYWAALVLSGDDRYGAIGACAVATLGYLQIGVVLRRGEATLQAYVTQEP